MPKMDKEYVGDGAYVSYDGYSIWLTTEDGYSTTNKVCLEPSVLKTFLEYVQRVKNANEAAARKVADEVAEEMTKDIPY